MYWNSMYIGYVFLLPIESVEKCKVMNVLVAVAQELSTWVQFVCGLPYHQKL